MNSSKFLKILFFMCLCTFEVKAWDSEELEIFDLVEEINENFYSLLGIKQDANTQEIKKAFRNLSIVLHPDKNSAEDANIKFRNLVSVYEVLKDSSKREKYDEVLKNGLPNWKSAMYYYRRVRKMGLLEMTVILFVLITVGQYIVAWAAFAEKKHSAEKIMMARLKKTQRKANKTDSTTLLEDIPRPSVFNTLPFQIVGFFCNLPSLIKNIRHELNERKRLKEEQILREQEEQEELERAKEQYERQKESRAATRRKRQQQFKPPEMTDEDYQKLYQQNNDTEALKKTPIIRPVISGGLWTDDDLAELIRLVKKYPGGTPERWERIAEAMNRPVPEVTHMAAKMKENFYRIGNPEDAPQTTVDIAPEVPKKMKTKGGKLGETLSENASNVESSWSQEQQKALESALTKYPKNSTQDRWDKIAKCVQGKNKEECILRYKYLVELVKKQNQPKDDENSPAQEDTPASNDM